MNIPHKKTELNIPRLLRKYSDVIGDSASANSDVDGSFVSILALNAADEIERLQIEVAYWKEKTQLARNSANSAGLILSSSVLHGILNSDSINNIDSEPILFAISKWVDENTKPIDSL